MIYVHFFIERLPYATRSAPITKNANGISKAIGDRFALNTPKNVRKPIISNIAPAITPIIPKALPILSI